MHQPSLDELRRGKWVGVKFNHLYVALEEEDGNGYVNIQRERS